MKIIIKKAGIAFGLLFFCSGLIWSQGIRKDYLEMTAFERDAVIDAYWLLGNDTNENGPLGSTSLIAEIGDFHNDHFRLSNCSCPDPIHFNTQNLDVFLAWHRQASVELEREMKDAMNNEWITIPYWDWTISNSKSDALWGNNWIGPFDSAWDLDRVSSSSVTFPTQTTIQNTLNSTNFDEEDEFFAFSEFVENSSMHVSGHTWVASNPSGPNGVMATGESPKDPTFFFHHNMVDKIWADWYELHGTPGGNYYVKTNMPRFDGTHTNAVGTSLPSVDPDDIADPRSLGIFYAENQLAVLDKYSVSNDNTNNEHFGYQYTIEAKDNFIVPSGKNATFKSCNKILLKPGFHARPGSTFLARSDNDCNFGTSQLVEPEVTFLESNEYTRPVLKSAYSTFEGDNNEILNRQSATITTDLITASPNPFIGTTNIIINVDEATDFHLAIYDLNGRQIKQLTNGLLDKGTHVFEFEAKDNPPGVYLARVTNGEEIQTLRIILAK